MVVLTAKRLGYDTLCMTMGESKCDDILISSQICNDYGQEHTIYELNNGLYLMNFDEAIVGNGGTIMAPGYLHSYRLKSLYNFNNYGAIHSGDLGDLIMGGSLIGKIDDQTISLKDAMYGSVFLDGFTDTFKEREINRYKDQFHFNYYNRGLNSAGNGCIATQCFTECSSPFLDKDLAKLMFSVPYNELYNHKLYLRYLESFLPGACNYIWTGTGCKPNASGVVKRANYLKNVFFVKVLHKKKSMNPYDMWYSHNTDLQAYFKNLFNSGSWIAKKNPGLWADLNVRFSSKKVMDKSLACTLICLCNHYQLEIV